MKDSVCFITSYSGNNIEPEDIFRQDGCYGSEYALYEIARRLTQIFNVFITVGKPRDYYKRTKDINWIADTDYNKWVQYARPKYIVVVRFAAVFIDYIFPKGSKVVYWLHDPIPLIYRQPQFVPKTFMFNINRIVDKFVSVGSTIIKNSYTRQWGLDIEKFVVIRNGVNTQKGWNPEMSERRPLSFCFTTTPSRGLWPLLDIGWPMIMEKFPEATLDLFYGYDPNDLVKVEKYVERYPMITVHGKVKQSELFEKYKEIEYWLYPCTEQETCCTTCFETAYFGPIQITNTKGALDENVTGFKLPEGPQFWDNVLGVIESLESNLAIKKSIRKRQFASAMENTWGHRAGEWATMLHKIDYKPEKVEEKRDAEPTRYDR